MSTCAVLRKNLKKYFPDFFGDDPWVKVSRNLFLSQVAEVSPEVQEGLLNISMTNRQKIDSQELFFFLVANKA